MLVLGGTGLLGSAIARRFLDEGLDVRVLSREAPTGHRAEYLDGAELLTGDAVSPLVLHDALEGVDHVVDALGAPHPAASANAPVAQFGAELPGLLGVLDELSQRPGVSLTYLSSGGAIYGNPPVLPVAEDAECRPLSPYGVTKLAAERFILMAHRRDGLDARVLRVGNAYGPFQRPRTGQGLVAALLEAARSGAIVDVFGDGSQVRDYVEVRDVADAAARLLGAGGEVIVNVGSARGHRVDEVVSIVRQVTGAPVEVRYREARPTDVKAVVLDTARLGDLVDWRPRPLERGIAEMWATWERWASDAQVTSEHR